MSPCNYVEIVYRGTTEHVVQYIDVINVFYVFYSGHIFYVFLRFLFLPRFLFENKNVAKCKV